MFLKVKSLVKENHRPISILVLEKNISQCWLSKLIGSWKNILLREYFCTVNDSPLLVILLAYGSSLSHLRRISVQQIANN